MMQYLKQSIVTRRTVGLSLAIAAAGVVMLACPQPGARAAFHLWQIKEVYSNADGSVQFVELFNEYDFEAFIAGKTIEASSDGVIKTFTFPSDITTPPDTANRHLLIATAGFAGLPGGITPDFTFDQSTTPISGPLFNPSASRVILSFPFSGSDMGFSGVAPPPEGFVTLPTNGTQSITNTNLYNDPILVVATNSPKNYSNQSGSVNAVPEPAGAVLVVAAWGLFGLRLRSVRQG